MSLRRVLLTATLATLPVTLSAQNAQKYAVQLAVLSTTIGLGNGAAATGGIGVEPQLRFNRLLPNSKFGRITLGVGGQWTTHTAGVDKITIAGVFLEPRWVPRLNTGSFYPYLSGRFSFLQQSNNFGTSSTGPGFGAGAGLAVVLTNTINVDAGVALVRQAFGDFELNNGSPRSFESFNTYAAKIGFSMGFPSRRRSSESSEAP